MHGTAGRPSPGVLGKSMRAVIHIGEQLNMICIVKVGLGSGQSEEARITIVTYYFFFEWKISAATALKNLIPRKGDTIYMSSFVTGRDIFCPHAALLDILPVSLIARSTFSDVSLLEPTCAAMAERLPGPYFSKASI